MPTKPMPVRMEPELQRLLIEGSRRTPHKKQELVRITLRRYLPMVIEAESTQAQRITNIEPWSERELKKAYQRVGKEWDELEEIATRAQGAPNWND